MIPPAGLGYLFWHAPSTDVSRDDYEEHLVAWQKTLGANRVPGFRLGWTWRLHSPPFLPGWPEECYLDVYELDDFAALGTINAAVMSVQLRPPHDALADRSDFGDGALYARLSGDVPDSDTATLRFSATPPDVGEGRSLWQRQLVLGPGPQFLLVDEGEAGPDLERDHHGDHSLHAVVVAQGR